MGGKTTPTPGGSDKERKSSPTAVQGETLSTRQLPDENTPHSQQPDSTPTTTAAPVAATTAAGGMATPPPLPPRSPTKEKLSRKSSSSSTSSVSSNGRCPKCRSHRKAKASVSKTVSLDHRSPATVTKVSQGTHDECRKSLPDLADPKGAHGPPENGLGCKGHRHAHGGRSREHSHCSKCSPASSTDGLHGDSTTSLQQSQQNLDYLQLVGEEQKKDSSSSSSLDNELGAEMDLLNSCLQTLVYLENKMNATPTSTSIADRTSTMTSAVSNSSPSAKLSTSSPMQGGGAVGVGSKVVPGSRKSVYDEAKSQAQMALAELNQPLQHHSTVTTERPVSNGHLPHKHNSLMPKQNSLSSLTAHAPPSSFVMGTGSRGHQHHPNGTLPVRSASSMATTTPPASSLSGHAPPVPPRSMVSLTDTLAIDTTHSLSLSQAPPTSSSGLSRPGSGRRQPGYPRSVSSGSMHLPPNRSPSSSSIGAGAIATPTSSTRAHPSLMRHQHLNHTHMAEGGSTVFIHHLKDRRGGGLTHLV